MVYPLLERPRPRVYIYDAITMRRQAQLMYAADINRSYALRERTRQATFTIPQSDPSASLTSVALMNIVWIDSDEYTLPWVGRIIERELDHVKRQWKVTADSYDVLLSERPLPAAFTTPAGAAQAVAAIMQTANARNDTQVGVGEVDALFCPVLSLSDAKVSAALDKVAEMAGAEWWLAYTDQDGMLHVTVNLAQERGADYSTLFSLTEPGNFAIPSSRESGRGIAYAQTVIGGQITPDEAFTDRQRAVAVRDGQFNRGDALTSQAVVEGRRVFRHGYLLAGETSFLAPTQRREYVEVREELKVDGLAPGAAEALLVRQTQPYHSLMGRVYPDTEGQLATGWRYLQPGCVVHLLSANAFGDGYDGPLVVTGVQPAENQRWVDIVGEVA